MRKQIFAAAVAMVSVGTAAPVLALDVAWVYSTAAAQSEQRVKAGFEAWLADSRSDWNVSFFDSNGSGEAIASNIQDASARGVDAIIVTMADLRASTAAIAEAAAAGIPIFSVDSGYVDGAIVDVTTNKWAMSAIVSPYLLDHMGGEGVIILVAVAVVSRTTKLNIL